MKIKSLTYLLFVISNLLLLFNPGIFWDDWSLYTMPPEAIYSQFNSGGIGYFGYVHVFLQDSPHPPLLYHILTFGLQLISIFFLYEIIKRLPLSCQRTKEGNMLVLFYTVLPFYDAKITMICFPYTLSLTLFVLATFFLVEYKNNRKIFFRILSLLLYFLSFTTVSLAFFYLAPFFFVIFLEEIQLYIKNKVKIIPHLINLFIEKTFHFLDFLLLPLLFLILKNIFFSPSNHYEGYNEIKLESFIEIPYRLVRAIYAFFVTLYPFLMDLIKSVEFILLFIILSGLIFISLSKLKFKFKSTKTKFFLGLIICFIGIFPYILVEKYPTFYEYSSRHQLLLGFGVSLLVINLIFLISSEKIRNQVLAMCIGFLVIMNVFLQFNYFKGFMKQVVMDNYFESQDLSKDFSQTIFFKDNTSNFTLKGNPSRFYELSGILKLSHPNENILIIEEDEFHSFIKKGTFKKLEPYLLSYNLSNYEWVQPSMELKVEYSGKSLPTFPMTFFYGNFLKGNEEEWKKFFEFSLTPL